MLCHSRAAVPLMLLILLALIFLLLARVDAAALDDPLPSTADGAISLHLVCGQPSGPTQLSLVPQPEGGQWI